jgi:XTP/dITP diphosphohydrolase
VRAFLATTNPHKARELERLLPGWRIEQLGELDYPPETGETFAANALGKARFARAHTPADAWVLGEDSGIEAAALGGAPGVYSARWAAGDEVGKMLAALAGETDRRARYTAAIAAVAPDGAEIVVEGTLSGRIAEAPAGTQGFGYDPVFVPDGEVETVAALGDAWKAEHSHRAAAARALLSALAAGATPS